MLLDVAPCAGTLPAVHDRYERAHDRIVPGRYERERERRRDGALDSGEFFLLGEYSTAGGRLRAHSFKNSGRRKSRRGNVN